jgi:outer membrane lipoprotein
MPVMMKRYLLLAMALAALTSASCVSVLRDDLMKSGVRNFSFTEVMKNPGLSHGKLFILGGRIVDTKLTEEGSLVEAIYVPVDWTGALKDLELPTTRFLALSPKEAGILDPMIYNKNSEVTLAAVFDGIREGKIDDMEYAFPFFRIRQIYLWGKRPQVSYGPPYYGPWPYPYWGPRYYGGGRYYYIYP